MRQWRVGSFSMGVVLILLGVALLTDLLKGHPAAFNLLYTWWPVALILLGLEVLAAGLINRNGQVHLRYDFLSMFLVLVFFFFSLTAYSLQVSGIFPWLREAVVSRSYTVPLPVEEIPLAEVTTVVVTGAAGDLEIRSTSGGTLTVFGQAALFAPTAEEAAELVAAGKVQSYRSEDTLFVDLPGLPTREGFGFCRARSVKYTVLVPAAVTLEARDTRFSGEVTMTLDNLAASWSVQAGGPVNVSLHPELNAVVYGMTESGPEGLQGSAGWEIVDSEHPGAPVTQGRLLLGEGTWPLEISARREIAVNILRLPAP